MENTPAFTVSPSAMRAAQHEQPEKDSPLALILGGIVLAVAGCAVAIPFALYIYLPLVR